MPRRSKYILPTALFEIILEMSRNVYNVPEQRCVPTAMGINGNGRSNGMGTGVAHVPIAAVVN